MMARNDMRCSVHSTNRPKKKTFCTFNLFRFYAWASSIYYTIIKKEWNLEHWLKFRPILSVNNVNTCGYNIGSRFPDPTTLGNTALSKPPFRYYCYSNYLVFFVFSATHKRWCDKRIRDIRTWDQSLRVR